MDHVNRHREDGEEAVKRTSKVVPLDAGENSESVQVAPESKSRLERNKPVGRKGERGSKSYEKQNRRP